MGALDTFAVRLKERQLGGLPDSVVENAKLTLAHNLIVAAAAKQQTIAGEWSTEGTPQLHAGLSLRMRDGRYVPVQEAIMSNSLLMGARAQHDEHPHSVSHFGSTVIPALLACVSEGNLAGANRWQGREFLGSMVLGYQAGAALAAVCRPATTARGFRPTGLFGPFASAAAVALARGGTEAQIRSSLAFALSTASALTQVWRDGTDEWRFQTAHAARSGYESAHFAMSGAQAAPGALTGVSGFLHAFAGVALDEVEAVGESVIEQLDRPWAMNEMLLKPYPVCAINQAAVVQAIQLFEQYGVGAERVQRIEIRLSPSDAAYPGIHVHEVPRSWAQAMMSLPFAISTALTHQRIDYAHLTPPFDRELHNIAQRVTVIPDETIGGGHGAFVTIFLHDGTRISADGIATVLRGWQQIHELAQRLQTDHRLSQELVRHLVDAVQRLDSEGGLDTFVRVLNELSQHR